MILTLVPSKNGKFPGLKLEAASDAEAVVLSEFALDRHGVTIEAKSGASLTFDAANLFAQMPLVQ